MQPDSFVIVLHYSFARDVRDNVPGAADVIESILSKGYEHCFFDDLIRNNVKYKYVVSNHRVSGTTTQAPASRVRLVSRAKNWLKGALNRVRQLAGKSGKYVVRYSDPNQYAPLQIGINPVRFMYGADIGDGWSLQDWNKMYKLFLCHGPNDEAQLRKRFSGKTAVMGYPRYDRFFSSEIDVNAVVREFGIDRDRETILWMPTLGDDACSIPSFAESIARLSGSYNVIVRPHPLSFQREPHKIEILESLGFKIDSQSTRDMNDLFKVADLVVCDYGGSSFGAIYLGKKLVLLNVPGAEEQYTVVNSSNLELREHFVAVDVEDAHRLQEIIEDEVDWETQEQVRQKLSRKYFAENYGTSARRAAEILMTLDRQLDN